MTIIECQNENCHCRAAVVRISPDGEILLGVKGRHHGAIHVSEIPLIEIIRREFTKDEILKILEK